MGNTDVTLTATWTKIAVTHTITFDPAGGSVTESTRSVEEGAAYGTLPTPSRSGYDFTGWINTAGGPASASDTMGTSDITLYATWKGKTYTITYNLNGGTNIGRNPDSFTVGDTTPLDSAIWSDHIFDGWYDASGTQITSVSQLKDNTTLTAHWKIQYYVQFSGTWDYYMTLRVTPGDGTTAPTSYRPLSGSAQCATFYPNSWDGSTMSIVPGARIDNLTDVAGTTFYFSNDQSNAVRVDDP